MLILLYIWRGLKKSLWSARKVEEKEVIVHSQEDLKKDQLITSKKQEEDLLNMSKQKMKCWSSYAYKEAYRKAFSLQEK